MAIVFQIITLFILYEIAFSAPVDDKSPDIPIPNAKTDGLDSPKVQIYNVSQHKPNPSGYSFLPVPSAQEVKNDDTGIEKDDVVIRQVRQTADSNPLLSIPSPVNPDVISETFTIPTTQSAAPASVTVPDNTSRPIRSSDVAEDDSSMKSTTEDPTKRLSLFTPSDLANPLISDPNPVTSTTTDLTTPTPVPAPADQKEDDNPAKAAAVASEDVPSGNQDIVVKTSDLKQLTSEALSHVNFSTVQNATNKTKRAPQEDDPGYDDTDEDADDAAEDEDDQSVKVPTATDDSVRTEREAVTKKEENEKDSAAAATTENTDDADAKTEANKKEYADDADRQSLSPIAFPESLIILGL